MQEGGSLADALAAGVKFPLRRALEIALDCVRGLNYLHQESPYVFIHRDLKPSNVMFKGSRHCSRAELALDTGTAKLTDFGLSKSLLQVRDLRARAGNPPLHGSTPFLDCGTSHLTSPLTSHLASHLGSHSPVSAFERASAPSQHSHYSTLHNSVLHMNRASSVSVASGGLVHAPSAAASIASMHHSRSSLELSAPVACAVRAPALYHAASDTSGITTSAAYQAVRHTARASIDATRRATSVTSGAVAVLDPASRAPTRAGTGGHSSVVSSSVVSATAVAAGVLPAVAVSSGRDSFCAGARRGDADPEAAAAGSEAAAAGSEAAGFGTPFAPSAAAAARTLGSVHFGTVLREEGGESDGEGPGSHPFSALSQSMLASHPSTMLPSGAV